MKKENEDSYVQCADFLTWGSETFDDGHKLDIIADIEEWMEAVIDRPKAERDIHKLLDSWHEQGIMKPK